MKKTPLYNLHRRLNAKMADFAGYEMPIQYEGIFAEHKAVREKCGVFDVSHMGHAAIRKPEISRLLSRSLLNIKIGKGAYTLILKENGGIIDDTFIYRFSENYWHIVLNASRKEVDVDYLSDVEPIPELAMLAVQGPEVISMLGELCQKRSIAENIEVLGIKIIFAARTGYTGEDGYELILPVESAETFMERLIDEGVKPCGLGARDLLRLEAALPLYGHEITEEINPYEAGLGFAVELDRDFIARKALVELQNNLKRKRTGLLTPKGPVPRQNFDVLNDEEKSIGIVTSGSFSPLLDKGIALALIDINSKPASIKIRNSKISVEETDLPFYRRKRV